MVKETALRRMVYAATGLVIGVAALFAFVFIPRLAWISTEGDSPKDLAPQP